MHVEKQLSTASGHILKPKIIKSRLQDSLVGLIFMVLLFMESCLSGANL